MHILSESSREKERVIACAITGHSSKASTRLLLQIFGIDPCPNCGYIKSSCICHQGRRIPNRPWTKFCRNDRAKRLTPMRQLRLCHLLKPPSSTFVIEKVIPKLYCRITPVVDSTNAE